MTDTKSPQDSTIRKLFALSMNRCAFPDCPIEIIDRSTNTVLGETCHIRAKSSGGPRYDAQQTPEERHAFENLILLCRNHHKIIDDKNNLNLYTIEYLEKLKLAHEESARKMPYQESLLTESLISELKKALEDYSPPSVYMDFKGAQFKAGGDGGYWGGAGGDGGVINIVGVAPAGLPEPINLSGGSGGEGPGSGGGGGGVLIFTGRPADMTDLDNGLRIPTIFLANSAETVQGLFYILGGGWEWGTVQSVPSTLQLQLVCMIETGDISINTMLRIDYFIEDAKGDTVFESYFDLTVVETPSSIRRYTVMPFFSIEISHVGIWSVKMSSGSIPLAQYNIEFRLASG
jgi:hypothetical protein